MEQQRKSASSGQPRIDLWRLTKRTLLTLFLPVLTAIAIDVTVGTWPIITLLVAGITFPVAGIMVIHSLMQEMQRVIQVLAPETTDTDESRATDASNATAITEV